MKTVKAIVPEPKHFRSILGLLVELAKLCQDSPPYYTKEFVLKAAQHERIIIAVEDEIVVGVMVYGFKCKTFWVRDLIVKSVYRHRGIGTYLLAVACAMANRFGEKRVSLHAHNRSIDFYKRRGFRISRRNKNGCRMTRRIL